MWFHFVFQVYNDDNPYIIAGLKPKLYTSFLPDIIKFDEKIKFNSNYYLILREFDIYQD